MTSEGTAIGIEHGPVGLTDFAAWVGPHLPALGAMATRRWGLPITLYYLADLPVVEVAALLSIAEGTVKSQLSDARSTLRRLLEETPDD